MNYYETVRSVDNRRSNRYRRCKLLRDLETGECIRETRDINSVPYSNSDIFHTIQANEISRLDYLAYLYYNNALLWWVIAEANEISDPTEPLTVGITLRIPTIESLYVPGGPLS